MKNLMIVIIMFLITSCSTASVVGPKISHSGFDNSLIVRIDPHGTMYNSKGLVTSIGASWNSSNPDIVILSIQIFYEYHAITEAFLNIDGKKFELLSTKTVTDLNRDIAGFKSSTKGFIVSIKTIDEILKAKRVWLKINTPTGYAENGIIDGEKDSKAYHALKRFIESIHKEQNK
ncbi:MAG: hypothetical protein GY874_09375 [Desulfobacteraceae bacterium]|nr:hypothetical protein [Desulfobacteraceae bacterium]